MIRFTFISGRKAKRVAGYLLGFPALGLFISCHQPPPEKNAFFEGLTAGRTGLTFNNTLKGDTSLNLFNYMYYYNGSGIGAADFNNDGKIDLFFASNQGQNKLFLNEGRLHFKDVTSQSKIPADGGWSTGVSVVDINNDGYTDIYVCKVGNYKTLKGRNQLLVCQGIDKNGVPFYKDEAAEYGIDFSGFSTQGAFFDFDGDGDLDFFLMNHPVSHDGNFAPRSAFQNTVDSLAGDKLYRNDRGRFTDVTVVSGINSTKIGYGLGLCISDINLDGWPDIYVGNDFHENDYLYINQQNGKFREESDEHIMHTSKFSMGVDIADANNDGFPEIITMDMLPYDPYILKRSLGEDENDIFYGKINIGYNYQYARNTLQVNRRNGRFSETGLYSGIYATDWSWSSLWLDFDNDGLKDLFISNGIPKRVNDIDYVNFVSGREKIQQHTLDREMELINRFPEIKTPNKFFLNSKELRFRDISGEIPGNIPSFSNGAVYADMDNDGDLDIVVNNINDNAILYENKLQGDTSHSHEAVTLVGPAQNRGAIGAKLLIFAGDGIRAYENYSVHGFQSSMTGPLHIGLIGTSIDSAFLIWPDNTFEKISLGRQGHDPVLTYKKGLPVVDYSLITTYHKASTEKMADITAATGLGYIHHENNFAEFNRESLLPHKLSTEGPALAVGDINKDGLDDVFLGSSRGFRSCVFVQEQSGKFSRLEIPAIAKDSTYEDIDACFEDVDNDGNVDIIVASGGNEYYGNSEFLLPRVYLNSGKNEFYRKEDAFSGLSATASCIVPYDFNRDGSVDLFVGSRTVPWSYGDRPPSYLLQNDGTGRFTDVTTKYAKDLQDIGFVTQARWFDIDTDGDQDLLLSLEWDGIVALINNNGAFSKKVITDKKGWWNFVLPFDADGDGDIDLIAGNLGLNARLTATDKQPVRLYYNDFDDNGKAEQVMTYYLQGKEIPFASKGDLEKKIPKLKKKFLYAEDFAKASLEDLFTKEKIKGAKLLTADYFSNALLLNKGNLQFEVRALPWEAQLTSYKDAVTVNANNDSLPDVFLGGNFYNSNVALGRYDADFGTILVNKGQGRFASELANGVSVTGQIRHIKKLRLPGGKEAFILARNNDSAVVVKFIDRDRH